MRFLPRILRRPRTWILAIIVIAVGGGILFQRGQETAPYQTVRVESGTLLQEVSVTGRVQARESVTLGFEKGGTVARVPVEVGDRVEEGTVLAVLDTRSLSLEVEKASAARAASRVDAEVVVVGEKQDLTDVRAKSAKTLEKSRQAVRDAKVELDQTKDVRQQSIREDGDESKAARNALLNVQKAETTYHAAQEALREAQENADQLENTALTALDAARANLTEVLQASRDDPRVSVLAATIRLADVALSNASLHAPFDGVVTSVDVQEGALALAGTAVVTVETADAYEIVADVPETDVAKLIPGQGVSVTLDALKDAVPIAATLEKIDPAANIIEGVPTYHVTLTFIESDTRIRSGMTADISIRTGERTQALVVPLRAVKKQDGRVIVRVLTEDGRIEQREVVTGLRGSDGRVEIIRGLSGGEEILTGIPSEDGRSRRE